MNMCRVCWGPTMWDCNQAGTLGQMANEECYSEMINVPDITLGLAGHHLTCCSLGVQEVIVLVARLGHRGAEFLNQTLNHPSDIWIPASVLK